LYKRPADSGRVTRFYEKRLLCGNNGSDGGQRVAASWQGREYASVGRHQAGTLWDGRPTRRGRTAWGGCRILGTKS